MRMKLILSVLSFALFLVACGDPSNTLDHSERHVRVAEPFDTYGACERAQKDSGEGLFNCYQSIELCSNGGVDIVVTDIINEGLYRIDDDRLHVEIMSPGDIPSTLEIERAADGTLQTPGLPSKNPWTQQTLNAEEQKRLDEGCAAMEGRDWW